MKLYNTKRGIIINHNDQLFLSTETNWDAFINRQYLFQKISGEIEDLKHDYSLNDVIENELLAPISSQEVWASGVTYLRSRTARIEESKDAGGGTFYDRVYHADRPELFFKAPAYRTVGSGDDVRIRKDSKWNVPELNLLCSSARRGQLRVIPLATTCRRAILRARTRCICRRRNHTTAPRQ